MRLAVLLSALAVACSSSAPPRFVTPVLPLSTLPSLGDVLPDPGPTSTRTLVSPSQTWPSYDTVIDGVPYTLGLDREHRVRYVATTDPRFRTPEGLKMGDASETVLRAAPGQEIVLEPGWGHFVELPSGWRAFLDNPNPNLGTGPLGPKARVTMFFLRD